MSKKEVLDSQHRFTVAKAPVQPRGKTTFLDGVDVSTTVQRSTESSEVYYGPKAQTLTDPVGAFAKKTTVGEKTLYEVKFATLGASVGRMLDPNGLYFNPGDEVKYEKSTGKMRYEYRKVTKSVFDSYLKFLETGSQKYLLNAEREAI